MTTTPKLTLATLTGKKWMTHVLCVYLLLMLLHESKLILQHLQHLQGLGLEV